MSTSIFEARLAFDSTEHGDDKAFSAHYAQTLANNIAHFYDSMGQVRVAWSVLGSGSRPGGAQALTPITPTSTSVWYPISYFGPFPLTLQASGAAFPMRVRLAGGADQNLEVSFRAILAPAIVAPERVLDESDLSDREDFTTTNPHNTPAWLSPAVDNLISLSADKVAAGTNLAFPTRKATGDTTEYTTQVALMTLSVWAKTTNVTATPQLTGLYAAEVLSP